MISVENITRVDDLPQSEIAYLIEELQYDLDQIEKSFTEARFHVRSIIRKLDEVRLP